MLVNNLSLFWPCTFLQYGRFADVSDMHAASIRLITLKMETEYTSETSTNYTHTRCKDLRRELASIFKTVYLVNETGKSSSISGNM